jgi:hypothetical protein
MTEPAHLNDEQMARYRDRELTPRELLDVDSHLSTCADCRSRLYSAVRTTQQLRELRREYSEHLRYADIVACSEGSGNALQLQHIRECPSCQAEVLDLSHFRSELADTPRKAEVVPMKPWARYRLPAGIAAAVLLVAGGITVMMQKARAPQVAQIPAAEPVQRAEASIPQREREILDRALATRSLEKAPVLEGLIARQGTLLGQEAKRDRIDLHGPVGTAVLTDQPIFRWTPIPDAASYVVAIFDEKFQKITESPALEGTEWKSSPLPHGIALNWQVTAKTRNGSVRAPMPPAPEARFRVLDPEVGQRIDAIRRDHPGNPLLLAALYAHEGALDDAQTALQAIDNATAQSYVESLMKIRRGE